MTRARPFLAAPARWLAGPSVRSQPHGDDLSPTDHSSLPWKSPSSSNSRRRPTLRWRLAVSGANDPGRSNDRSCRTRRTLYVRRAARFIRCGARKCSAPCRSCLTSSGQEARVMPTGVNLLEHTDVSASAWTTTRSSTSFQRALGAATAEASLMKLPSPQRRPQCGRQVDSCPSKALVHWSDTGTPISGCIVNACSRSLP